MNNNRKRNSFGLLLIVSGILLFSYSISRACLLSFTWDESYTYLEFVNKGIIFPHEILVMSANNHLLNTWLEIIFVKCFGVSDFLLRLPSLVGHFLFLLYSAKLVRKFEIKVFAISSFVILNLNPYLLDFFSLARGYGLSMGMLMTSFYFLFRFFSTTNKKQAGLFSSLFSALAVLANLAVLPLCILLNCIILFFTLKTKENNIEIKAGDIFKNSFFLLLFLVLTVCLILPYSFHLKSAGAFFYGGRKTFYTDTISETITRLFYGKETWPWTILFLKIVFGIIFLSSCFWAIKDLIRKKFTDKNLFFISIFFLIIGCSIASIVQHYGFGLPFLTGRTALHLVLLAQLLLILFFREMTSAKIIFGFYLIALLVAIHFIASINFKYVYDWKTNAETKEMLADMEKLKNQSADLPVLIYSSVELSEPVDYYLETKKLYWMFNAPLTGKISAKANYFYFTNEDFAKMPKENFELIHQYPVSQTILAKIKNSETQ